MFPLTKALVDASNQVMRMAAGVDAVAQLDARRLEELVEERIASLSNVNRNLVDSQWRRRQLLDRTVRVAEGERARIAANLHDGPIQRLAALGLVLDRCALRLDRDDRDGALDLVKRARQELSEEIQQPPRNDERAAPAHPRRGRARRGITRPAVRVERHHRRRKPLRGRRPTTPCPRTARRSSTGWSRKP